MLPWKTGFLWTLTPQRFLRSRTLLYEMASNTEVISAGVDTSTMIGWEESRASSTITGSTSLMIMMSRCQQQEDTRYVSEYRHPVSHVHCQCEPGATYHAPGRFSSFHTDVLKETGKALIEPEVIPPVHGHNVPKPLEKTTNMSIGLSNKGNFIWNL